MKTIEFEHDIGDSVRIVAIDILARIDALIYDIQGKQYRIVYWSDGSRNAAWVYDWEIVSR